MNERFLPFFIFGGDVCCCECNRTLTISLDKQGGKQ